MSESIKQLAREAGTRVSLGPTPNEFPNNETYAQHVTSIIEEVLRTSDLFSELIDQAVEEQVGEVSSGCFNQGYTRGYEDCREQAAKVADAWAQSHSCDSHDDNPCCHVRTGFSITEKIRELKCE